MPTFCERLQEFCRCRKRKSEAAKEGTEEGIALQEDYPEAEPTMESPKEILPPPLLEGEMPTFFHVGGMAKLSLLDGYSSGLWGLQTTTKTKHDLYLSSFGEGNSFLSPGYGGVEALQEMGDYHASLCWLTGQEFLSNLGARGEVFDGQWMSVLKLGATTAEEWQFTAKLKTGFDRNPIRVELEVPIYREPLFMGYLMVVPVEHFMLGYRTVFDIEVKKFGMHAFCLGYDNKSTELSLKLNNFRLLRGSIFQRLNENWALALKADIYGYVGQMNFQVGCQYEWEPGTLIKAKIMCDGRCGFIYERKLDEGIGVLLNCSFNGKDPLNGGMKLGAAWNFRV